MATGIFKLRDQLYGLVQKGWSGPVPNYGAPFNGSKTLVTSSTQIIPTGSYTIEFFVYITGTGVTQYMVAQGVSGGGSNSTFVGVDTNWIFQSGSDFVKGGTVIRNAWNYVAATYNGSTLNLYVNGSSIGSTAHTGSVPNAALSIGDLNAAWASSPFTGYMSNIRISNTVLTVTSVPTAPFTATANTVFLSLQNSTIVDNSTNAYSITNSGSIAMSTQAPFNNAVSTPAVEYLVVAGGGAGGGGYGYSAGGGGAGGLLQGIFNITTGTPLTVTVGAGGTQTSGDNGNPGVNSVFGSITAIGGGGGSDGQGNPGFAGGSGGGVGANSNPYSNTGGQGVFGQGNNGGAGWPSTSGCAGGGGGAGTVGLSYATYDVAGNGGVGIASAINGTVTTYAGGGGGGGNAGNRGGYGGVGGGGDGARAGASAVASTAGTANTGGGGGGGSNAYVNGSNGGSGICIISYPDIYNAPSALTGTYTASTSGSGSLYFGGSTQYLTYSANSFSTSGSWTIEAWCYFTSSSNQDVIVNGLAGDRLYVLFSGTNLYVGDSITNTIGVTSIKPVNQWFHLAIVKNGSTYTAYLNGTSIQSSTTALISATLTSWQVGGRTTTGYYTQGYISNLRIVNSAVYTTNFTPSTAPLTAISNTQLLLNTTSGAYVNDSSTNANTPTMTNTVSWNQQSPFATGLGYKNRVYTWTGSGTITF